MELSESLKSSENAIRDLFGFILSAKHGNDWVKSCGVSENRITKWKERQIEDQKKYNRCDPRLVYYADFYDLKTILKKNWEYGLSNVFGNLKEMEVFLDVLGDLRNPDAHRRELLPYQKHLILGMGGHIKTSISRYYSVMETRDSYYSRIESIQDSLGNTWSLGDRNPYLTNCIVRPVDNIQFQVSAFDPSDGKISYGLFPVAMPHSVTWNTDGSFDFTFEYNHVGDVLWIFIAVKNDREFHAKNEVGLGKVDDVVKFGYEVLPPRTKC